MRHNITNASFDEIFRDLTRFSVGFEPMFQRLGVFNNQAVDSYPPYNIEKIDDIHFNLSIAVAGFSKDALEVSIQDNVLTVKGFSSNTEDKLYLHKGIAGRSFKRDFILNNGIEIAGSDLSNGLLVIQLVMIQPEISVSKTIPIGYKLDSTVIDGK